MIEKMSKVQIIGPKKLLDDCIRTLHALAVVHIETVPAEVTLEDAFMKRLPIEKEKLKEKEFLDRAFERLKNVLMLLSPPHFYSTPKVDVREIKRLLAELSAVEGGIKTLHAARDDYTEELSMIAKYERLLKGFAPIVPRLGGLKNFDIVGLTIEKTREDIVGLLDAEINRITGGNYEIFVEDLDEHTTGVVLTYPRKYDMSVRHLLTGKSISEVRLPEEYEDMTLINALKQMEMRKSDLPGLLAKTEGELDEISRRWYGRLIGIRKAVEDALDEIGVITYAAQTRFTFVIEGWVPTKTLDALVAKFGEIFGEGVVVRELEIKEKEVELIPVYIRNPKILRPFEVFLSALPPPRYGSVDPTPYIAIFFPAFFGLIVGDIGYGAIVFLLSLYLRHRFKTREIFGDIASVLMVSSLSAVVFGFLFGEFFGDLGSRLGVLHPIIFHRSEALKTFLVLAIGIGVGHVVLGFVIGAVNHLHRHRPREAGAKATYIVLILSFLFVVGVIFDYLPRSLFAPGVVALFAAFVALIVMEGFLGPLEFIKVLGNILSYVRIMAVGTASVVMALVANKIGGLSDSLVLGILAASLIHILNIVLSIVSPAIQSMRLHYVEFFSKFYEGGGRLYKPFKKR